MDDVVIMDIIKKAGFSDYEVKCYLALLERDSMSVNEVAKLAGIPRPSTYDVLEQLMIKGLVSSVPGKTKRFAAADPHILREKSLDAIQIEIDNIDRRKKEVLTRKNEVQENIDGAINKLHLLFTKNRANESPLDYLEILKEPRQIQYKLIQLCAESTNEILFFIKPPFAFTTKDQEQAQVKSQNDAMDRGVQLRYIYELPPDEEKQIRIFKSLRDSIYNQNDHPRVTAKLPIKLAIFDDKKVMFTLEDPITGAVSLTSLIAEHHAMATSFKLLFETFWERAKDYYMEGDRRIYFEKKNEG
jgi:HTH-type transcriptional regulator, sugar sensing transcriptional regulator